MSWLKNILSDGKPERDHLLKGLIAGTLAVLVAIALIRVAGC